MILRLYIRENIGIHQSTTYENHIICEFLNCYELKYENSVEAIKINMYLKYQKG